MNNGEMKKREKRLEVFLENYRKTFQITYEKFAAHLLLKVKNALEQRGVDVAYTSARAKSFESLEKKCQKLIKDECGNISFKYSYFDNEIMDLAGIRIVTYLQEDVPVVQSIIRDLFKIHESDSGDKLELLGLNEVGYLSIHYIVELKDEKIASDELTYRGMKCEVQIRTVLEDAWAQIFHDRMYKSELPMELGDLLRKTNLVAGGLELLDYQINEIVRVYDRKNGVIQGKRLQRILDMPLNRENLLTYFECRLGIKTCFYYYDHVKKLLDSFSIDSIRSLDVLLQRSRCADKLRAHDGYLTSDKIIFYILMICDFEKFLNSIGENVCMSKEGQDFLGDFLPIEELCATHKICLGE